MIGSFTQALVEGYVAPRRSARGLLEGRHGLEAALIMLALAYLIQAILTVLFVSAGLGIGGHMLHIIEQLVTFFILSALIYWIGRLAGGTGSLEGAQLIVGWHALVTSFASPLGLGMVAAVLQTQADAEASLSGGAIFLGFLYAGIWLWLLANYVAELHGFRSTGAVLGAITGLMFATVILLTAIFGPMQAA